MEVVIKPIDKISISDIARFRDLLKVKYKLGDNSISQSMIIIKNFFKYHKAQGRAVLDPETIRVNRNFSVKSHNAIAEEDFHKMDASLSTSNFQELKMKCAIHLLWYGGLRVSELCDLDVVQVNERPKAHIQTKKNGKMRWVYWPMSTHRIIRDYLGIRNRLSSSHALFVGSTQKRMTTRQVQRWIKSISDRCGIVTKISPHSFRHGRAHAIKKKGGDIMDIASYLGHKHVTSAQVYAQMDDTYKEKKIRNTF